VGQKTRIGISYRLTLKRVQVARNHLGGLIMDYSDERQQHIEDTEYLTWADGMHVMLEDLECDYELAVIENSLRDSVWFREAVHFESYGSEDCIGVDLGFAGLWWEDDMFIKLTRAQALYIATGDVSI
tara:strand:- start:192 stop:575 length:384 start_codon:yes stop_codon:yes gene_type:complete